MTITDIYFKDYDWIKFLPTEDKEFLYECLEFFPNVEDLKYEAELLQIMEEELPNVLNLKEKLGDLIRLGLKDNLRKVNVHLTFS